MAGHGLLHYTSYVHFQSFPHLYQVYHAIEEGNLDDVKRLLNNPRVRYCSDHSECSTPLRFAIVQKQRKIFDYLLALNPAWQSSLDSENLPPLAVAAASSDPYFFQKLTKNGVDVTSTFGKYKKTLLHYAVEGNCLETVRCLLENGADINADDGILRTPLILACYTFSASSDEDVQENLFELVSMLLYYNANALTEDSRKNVPFGIAVSRRAIQLQELLFDYTYDQEEGLDNNHFVLWALTKKSPFFWRILERTEKVNCRENDKSWFSLNFQRSDPDDFRLFVEKFPEVLQSAMEDFNFLSSVINYEHLAHLLVMLRNSLGPNLVASSYNPPYNRYLYHSTDVPHWIAVLSKDCARTRQPVLEVLTEVVCCLLSSGLTVDSYDVHVFFYFFGDCELFNILLHMDIKNVRPDPSYNRYYSALCALKSTVMTDVAISLPRGFNYWATIYRYLFEYTMVPECREMVREYPCRNPSYILTVNPFVPSLKDLARNAARKHLIESLKLKKSSQLCTVINQLQVPDIIKKLLRFEVPLYNHNVRKIELVPGFLENNFNWGENHRTSGESDSTSEEMFRAGVPKLFQSAAHLQVYYFVTAP